VKPTFTDRQTDPTPYVSGCTSDEEDFPNTRAHLIIFKTTKEKTSPSYKPDCYNHGRISIVTLKDDIKDSVKRSPDGYMEDLRNNTDLQSKFVTAINQIFDPVITD
jgi:hypothetical protein